MLVIRKLLKVSYGTQTLVSFKNILEQYYKAYRTTKGQIKALPCFLSGRQEDQAVGDL